MSSNKIFISFLNKNKLSRPIFLTIKRPIDMFNLKKRLLQFFNKNAQPVISDFRMVTKEPVEDGEDDTIKDNYFDEKYNNYDAFDIIEIIKDSEYYSVNNRKEQLIYFRAVKLRINVFLTTKKSIQSLSFPLAYEGNSKEELISNIEKETNFKLSEQTYYTFQNTDNLDEIDEEYDMKKYHKYGLAIFVFPMQATFINKETSKKISCLLKFNRPLKEYLDQSILPKLRITSSHFLVKLQNNQIDIYQPAYNILKQLNSEPVVFEIHDTTPNKISISIPTRNNEKIKNILFNFEYTNADLTIGGLIERIKVYFGVKDLKIQLLNSDNKNISLSEKVSKFKEQTLTLSCDQSKDLLMKREYEINKKVYKKTFSIDTMIKSIINDIAHEFDIDESRINLALEDTLMNKKMHIGDYFIPADKTISVKIKEFTTFVILKFYGLEAKSREFGFIPEMKIKSLRKAVPDDIRKEAVFFLEGVKLDEKSTFDDNDIKGDEVIEVHCDKSFIFTYENEDFLIFGDLNYYSIFRKVQKHFNLKYDIFFIDRNGKLFTDETQINDCPNGAEFKVKDVVPIKFRIDDKFDIYANSNNQVKDIVEMFMIKSKAKDSIQLVKGDSKVLDKNAYLYSLFDPIDPSHVYELQSTKLEEYPFQTANGKFFSQFFSSSTKICDVLEELRSRRKNISIDSVIIYMGRVADSDSTLDELIGEINAEPLIIEDGIPDQITIELKFKIDIPKSIRASYRGLKSKFAFVKPCEVSDVHFLALRLCQQEYDSISLEANGKTLYDDEILEEDTSIIVDLSSVTQDNEKSKKDIRDILSITQKSIDFYKAQVLCRMYSEDSESLSSDSESFEKDEIDIFEKGNGTYEPSEDNPENEYIFKFKVIGGEEFKLCFPKEVTVEKVKEIIAENERTDSENIAIFVGNQRLADFNKLTNMKIPKEVFYFSVKIIDLNNSIMNTRGINQSSIDEDESINSTEESYKTSASEEEKSDTKNGISISPENYEKVVSRVRFLENLLQSYEKVQTFNFKTFECDQTKDTNKDDNFLINDDYETAFHVVLEELEEDELYQTLKIINKKNYLIMAKKTLKINEQFHINDAKNLIREYEILHLISHPCICKTYGINLQEKVDDFTTISVFLEFLDFNLSTFLDKNILSNTMKVKVIIEVAFGMSYIHKQGIIHRNLNLKNIKMNRFLEAKITNFCQVYLIESSSVSMTKNVGESVFMSPEIQNEEDVDSKYDNKTDVYSFGVILYKVFSGSLPNISLRDIMKKVQPKFPSPSPSISECCIELIKACMSYDPAERPSFDVILEFIKNHEFALSEDVDAEMISQRYQVLNEINSSK